MMIFVYVEGQSDVRSLEALWERWKASLRRAGHGIKLLSLQNKSQFLRKIGNRAATMLLDFPECVVVAMPDLYPSHEYKGTRYEHGDFEALCELQKLEVEHALTDNVGKEKARAHLWRFYPTALKHDLEMLLLAAEPQLRARLRNRSELKAWRRPVEDQNQSKPPKTIVEALFRQHLGKSYRETVDAPQILGKVRSMKEILEDGNGQPQCPVFKRTIDWMADRSGVAYP